MRADGKPPYQLGDVAVTVASCENPYTDSSVYRIGPERVAALRRFCDGGDTTGLKLWVAPVSGGARVISAAEVDWSGLRR